MEVLLKRDIALRSLRLCKSQQLFSHAYQLRWISYVWEDKGKDDTRKDFRVRRHQVEEALCQLKDNNPAYSNIVIDSARIWNLPEDGELPNLRTVEFSETEHMDDHSN